MAVVGGGVSTGLLLTQGTQRTLPAGESSRLVSVQTACQRWLTEGPGRPGTEQWCAEMAGWMTHEIESDGMGPQMMWESPASLQSACERWMTSRPPSGAPTNSHGWCKSMVLWMKTNIGDWTGRSSWGDWMREGPAMMGGFGSA